MCGGGSSPETQTVNQVRELPDWAQPYAEALLQSGMESLNQLPQQYTGMRVAPMNMDQNTALGMISGRATQGAPDEIAARQQATSTLLGDYLNSGPAAGYQTQVAQNPFMGANPYLQQYVQQGMQDMAGAYSTGVAAQTDAAASRNNM